MARKSTDIRALAQALKAPAFGNRERIELPAQLDPVSPTTLVLNLSDIKAYEHNPRHAENPEFDRLKESIAARRGLTTPLTVTKRPGEMRYTIAAGGNSRLQALNELYQETRDDVFSRVMCQFEPWESDCQVLANHLIENDVRGNMTFADKARAIVEWQQLYETTHPDDPPLSQRALEARLAETGFAVSHALLARYRYTAEFLLPALPNALGSGLGRPQIEQLIRLRTLAAQYWDEVPLAEGMTPAATFDEIFAGACAVEDRHCDDWDFDLFQSVLATRIAEALSLDPKVVALDLDSLYHGIPVSQLGSEAPTQQPEGESQWAFERAREHLAAQVERARQRQEARRDKDGQREEKDGTLEDNAGADSRSLLAPVLSVLPSLRSPSDLEAPRAAIYALARQVALPYGLNELVKSCDVGFGYYIDAPDPPESARSENVTFSGLRLWIWWWLALCAEQLNPSLLSAIGERDPDSWLVQLFEQLPQRAPDRDFLDALYLLVGQPDWLELGADLLTNAALADDVFGALIALLERCRALRVAAGFSDLALWEPAS